MVDCDLRALLPYVRELSGSDRNFLHRELVWSRSSDNGKQDVVRELLSFGPSQGLSAEELSDLIIKEDLTPEEASELVNGLGRVAKTLVGYHPTFRKASDILNQYGIPVNYKIPEATYIDA